MKIYIRTTFAFIFTLAPLASQAEFYKWMDENGTLQYSDVPEAEHAKKQSELRANKQKQIIIYTSDSCSHCSGATSWMVKNKLSFVEYNINKNRKAAMEYQQYNNNILPLLLLGDETAFGFGKQVKNKIKHYLK